MILIPAKKIVAILESMWDWRKMTSQSGYREAPRFFRINPENFSGKRLYRIVGHDANLLVTNSCKELCGSAKDHGTPNPTWLRENLIFLEPFDVLLVCGRVAQETYSKTGYEFEHRIEMPHPAARTWTNAMLDDVAKKVKQMCD